MTNYNAIVRLRIMNAAPSGRLLDPELRLHQLVHGLMPLLAAGRFHYLADESASKSRLRLRLLGLVGVGGNDLIHRFLNFSDICELFEPMLLKDNDRIDRSVLRFDDELVCSLCLGAGDFTTRCARNDGTGCRSRDTELWNNYVEGICVRHFLIDHPIGSGLGLDTRLSLLGVRINFFKVIGCLPISD